ncbi:hypothetical protein BGZ83_001652 [Gryganskiella cystojenkinii]|nr:hypothetical protein BGZ83_001641 [Gryganskiella cystojenkinii]KAG0053120.1 hypothetical protein BGZ83_001652 [Gryganskiella cystojenkinii]
MTPILEPETKQFDNRINPLTIPEIIFQVGKYLNRSQLVHCLLVSHLWHETFLPWFYYELNVYPVGRDTGTRRVSNQAVLEHASLIRKIAFFCNSSLDLLLDDDYKRRQYTSTHELTCPNLIQLEINLPSEDRTDPSQLAFLQRHREHLKGVTLDHIAAKDIIEALVNCPRLERLDVAHLLQFEDHQQFIHEFERLWSRLRTVNLETLAPILSINLTPTPVITQHWPRSTGPNRIQDLTMNQYDENTLEIQVWILKQCPGLIRLNWYNDDDRFSEPTVPMAKLAELMQDGHSFPDLKDLTLNERHFKDDDFESLLKAWLDHDPRCPAGTTPRSRTGVKLALECTNFSMGSWRVLRSVESRLLALKALNLSMCDQISGSAIQEMLCSLPNLEQFQAKTIQDTHIWKNDQPWVCLGLKDLSLSFRIQRRSGTRRSASISMILSRISQLTQLEIMAVLLLVEDKEEEPSLDTRGVCDDVEVQDINEKEEGRESEQEEVEDEDEEHHETESVETDEDEPIPLTLEDGLAQLSTLTRLQVVDSMVLLSGEEEIRWMIENWPQLEDPTRTSLEERLSEFVSSPV